MTTDILGCPTFYLKVRISEKGRQRIPGKTPGTGYFSRITRMIAYQMSAGDERTMDYFAG